VKPPESTQAAGHPHFGGAKESISERKCPGESVRKTARHEGNTAETGETPTSREEERNKGMREGEGGG